MKQVSLPMYILQSLQYSNQFLYPLLALSDLLHTSGHLKMKQHTLEAVQFLFVLLLEACL